MLGARSLPLFLAVALCVGAAADVTAGGTPAPQAQVQPAASPDARPRFALTFGYPRSGGLIGVTWEPTDRTAVRTLFSVVGTVSKDYYYADDSNTYGTYYYSIDLSLLRTVARKDEASVYAGPRITYARSHDYSIDYTVGAGGVLGLQYRLTRRISLYGEAGLDYEYERTCCSLHSISSRGSVGLNLYF